MPTTELLSEAQIWDLLGTIPDPEVPAISIVELGVVRDVKVNGNSVEIAITPTYNGCPALKMMEAQVKEKLENRNLHVTIRMVYKPAWTTDWMAEGTLQKLKDYGIAPPAKLSFAHIHPLSPLVKEPVACPFCNAKNTQLTSQFGSTACKALYFCDSCHQPFEHFKCH
ncbi:phenylacetate-CoA oxygenase subunit PaaJ [soil metagenome]